MKNAKLLLRKIFFIAAVITAMTVTGCKQPVKKDKGGEVKTFAVTVTPPLNGTITVKKGGELLNGAALKAVAENSEIEITLTANSGYKTVKLIVGDEEKTDSTDNGKTITKKVTVTKALTVSGEVVQNKSFTVNGVTFKMYDIESVKGAELGHTGQIDNKPHTVNLSAYSIGETEVTQGLYKAVMNVNPSYLNGDGSSSPEKATPSGEDQEKRPVESVDWYDAVLFCNELTKKINGNSVEECVYYSDAAFQHVYTNENANKKDLPYMNIAKKGFRLPTEAEWEWAAKGGKNNIWAGTDDEDALQEYAWYMDPNNLSFDPLAFVTHQTAIKKENGYKLFDMSGNVSEWCWDWYGKNLVSGETDPAGAKNGKYRVIRGGSFINTSEECECSFRSNREPHKAELTIGFRIVCRM